MRITELCEKRGYTKYRLSQLTEMSQTALGNILNKKSIPTVVTLERICDAFGITLSEFFLEDNNKTVMLNEQQLRLIYYAAKLNPEQYDSLLQFLELL